VNEFLLKNNYLVVEKFIKKKEAKEIAASYEAYALENKLEGDNQIPNSMACYNYKRFLELLCNKTQVVSTLLGENVLPTYAYGRVYGQGDTLKRHKDRDSCEISLTVNLSQTEPWPIFFQKPDGTSSSVVLNPGDAAVYLGCDAEHWREPYKGSKLVQVFLHYVRSNGKRFDFYFDKRRSEETSDLSKYIVYLEDIVPATLCDAILDEYEKASEWEQSTIGPDGVQAPEIRGAMAIPMSLEHIILKNPDIRMALDQQVYECASQAIHRYHERFPECAIAKDTGYQLLKYTAGTGYARHTDDFYSEPRVVSCSFCLNDEYTGGEFNMTDQGLSFKQKKGSALLFPSNFMYPHEVAKVTSGTRYSIVTWFR
jgi:alkylated DNA repair dioxygenase AlkB